MFSPFCFYQQSKDKLISSLKEGSTGSSEAGATSLINMEVEELKNERDMMRDELHQSNGKIEQLRTELQVWDFTVIIRHENFHLFCIDFALYESTGNFRFHNAYTMYKLCILLVVAIIRLSIFLHELSKLCGVTFLPN